MKNTITKLRGGGKHMPLYGKHYIAHYGVKGQKWGVRRYQNEDGTLTAAGKERYYNADEQKELYEHAKKSVKVDKVLPVHNSTIEGIDDISEAGGFLRNQSEVITKNFEEYTSQCRKDIAGLKDNPDFMKTVMKRLDEEFGGPDQVDDEEYLDWAVSDAVYDNFYSRLSQKTKDASKRFQDSVDQYRSNMESIVNDIVGEYGDQPVGSYSQTSTTRKGLFRKTTTTTTDLSYKDVVTNTLAKLGDSQWIRYLNNHTELAYADSDEMPALEKAVKEAWMKSK